MVFLLFVVILLFFHKSSAIYLNNNACPEYSQYPTLLFNKNCFYNPSVMSNTSELVEINGYNSQPYKIVTEDGYILHIFRVFKGNPKGQPVYIQHGFAHDSSCWLFTGNRSLAFNLVDLGYDVWLGNIRTTQYSKQHVNFTAENPNYWNFTLDEIAKFDLRNSLQKVALITEKPGEIIFIGHSQGTSLFFMYISEFSSDNLVKSMIALSPIAFFNIPEIARPLLPIFAPLLEFLRSIKITAFFSNIQPVHNFLQIICKTFPYLCKITINLIYGKTELFLPEDLTAYFSYFPDSFGVKQSEHALQLAYKNKLVKYDYGSKKNLEIYNTTIAPDYKLENIQIPIYLLYGKNDPLCTKEMMDKLYGKLVGSLERSVNTIPIANDAENEQFNHIDFLVADKIQVLFYKDLFDILKKFASS